MFRDWAETDGSGSHPLAEDGSARANHYNFAIVLFLKLVVVSEFV